MNYIDKDFIGFSFNGKHSFDFNLIRTSDGSRYNNILLPEFDDNVVSINSRDGSYYFGTQYKQRNLELSVAFDNLTEANMRNLQYWLGEKKLCPLVLDEIPYKYYMAKISVSPQLDFLAFEQNNERIYKGEGKISFIIYGLYGITPYEKQTLEHYDVDNIDLWATASGLKVTDEDLGSFNNGIIELYNPGDVPTDFKLIIKNHSSVEVKVFLRENGIIKKSLVLTNPIPFNSDEGMVIDTKSRLIRGLETISGQNVMNGNIYNRYITSGDFFQIPISQNGVSHTIKIIGYDSDAKLKLEYDYLYF